MFLGLEPDGTSSLKVVKTSGGATTQKIGVHNASIPSWSPDGKWIAYIDDDLKYHLVSPDGKQHRDLGLIMSYNLGFSKDGKTAYGIRQDGSKLFLFSIDIETAKLHDIKQLDRSLLPRTPLGPGIRFTLAPDGKSFAYAIAKPESSIWMLQGFDGK